jgi:hypothetical protein
MVVVPFTRYTEQGVEFSDSIHYTDAEYSTVTPEVIEAAKDARFASWVALTAFVPDETPPEEI